MKPIRIFIILQCILTGIVCQGGSAYGRDILDVPPERAAHKTWMRQTIASYRSGNAKLPDLPEQKSRVSVVGDQESRLFALYKTTAPESITAIAVAYWGALRARDPQIWVRRMLLATQQRSASTAEDDSRETLPEALEQVYRSRKKVECAVEGLVNLRLDGHYQENLDHVRFTLFHEDPEPFIHVLSRKRLDILRQEIGAKESFTFTAALVYSLSDDPEMTRKFERLRASAKVKHTRESQFLYHYLTMVLQSARAEKR